jgi:anti-sigma factor RsiW
MTCPTRNKQNNQILLDYCSGTLDPDRASEFEKHAAECADCGEFVTSQRAMWQALDEWTPADVSSNFDERLYARIAQEKAASPWMKVWRSISAPAVPFAFWKPALIAAVACAVLAVGFLIRVPGSRDSSPQIRIESVDADQMEKTLEDLDMLTPQAAYGNRI